MIATENEDKRSKIWRAVMAVTSILIILIAVFFIVKMFTSNPLEGTWQHDESSLQITVGKDGVATIQWPEEFEQDIKIPMSYSIDRETKTFILRVNKVAIGKAVKDSKGTLTEEGAESAIESLDATYDYSVDKKELTLTDREYGEQMIFVKE
ncbi:hypothetical protein [Hespellia stercorisuis]|uniref:Uncharacterized protein n=1 Tax=Hespellia stercorisuis DSM 15480 TaxID=1121950 RepID=A0A1M6HVZ0_9FIRM|nr:hypothetical protein [Hespellia stercorisuis]SHJ26333.1 hypothetical protein SAMN02745243_00171 [Hespellia stercorisuis DSM 15480]